MWRWTWGRHSQASPLAPSDNSSPANTQEGVAWARPQATNALQSPIQVIHNWPGCSTRNEQKVPTCLVYGRHERPTSWGFICEDDDDFETKRREFFKIFLDKMNLLEAQIKGLQGAPESVAQAQKFVTDYLSEVYVHVKSTIEHQTGIGPFTGWKDLAVEFLFSVPTTWRSFKIINTFKEAIKNAGFGAEGPRHVATVDLTESEAAAVATIKSTAITFEKDDIFLSVDAGGGTTDFALMQVVETKEPFPTLKQLTQVDGVGIGSTLIDRAFLDLVEDRVFPFSELVDQLPPDCIEKLVRSDKFRTAKHKFGERVYNAAVYKLPMEGVGYNFYHEGAGIESGRLLLTRQVARAVSTVVAVGVLTFGQGRHAVDIRPTYQQHAEEDKGAARLCPLEGIWQSSSCKDELPAGTSRLVTDIRYSGF